MAELVGKTLLNRYFIRKHVGSGGMADVYAAWDNLRSTRLAIKVLRRDLLNNPRFIEMFEHEAELLSQITHPNIVRLYEFKRKDDLLFIVMDWIDGTNLRQEIAARRKPFTLEEASAILEPITAALHFAHQNKVYHCDVKPANILLHVDGKILLTDFGVARYAASNGGAGTPPYMAPEQFMAEPIDERTDVYSLGVTIYEMLTDGELPFRGTTPDSVGTTAKERIGWEHVHTSVPSPRVYNSSISPQAETVILKALSKRKQDRYANTVLLREAFERARPTGQPSVPFKPTRSQRTDVEEKTIVIPLPPIPKINVRFQRPRHQVRKTTTPTPPRQARSLSGRPHLIGRRGEYARQGIPIMQGNLTIGRGAQNQMKLSERSVSRVHASIIRTRRGIYVRDEKSSMGTFVNGQRIMGPTKLRNRDIIQIGYANEFEYREK